MCRTKGSTGKEEEMIPAKYEEENSGETGHKQAHALVKVVVTVGEEVTITVPA
jgi:hypothetical protein